jgi:hypothetical protein
MTLWAVSVGADLVIHIGDIVATVTCALMLWMASSLYRLVKRFFVRMHTYVELVDKQQATLTATTETVQDHSERIMSQHGRLDDVEMMVDRHSRALTKWEPLEEPAEPLYRRRRRGDAHGLDEGIG